MRHASLPLLISATVASLAISPSPADAQSATNPMARWPQHSTERPRPPIITPGAPALPVPPPSDAIVLFDGATLANWNTDTGAPAAWRVIDGAVEVAAGKGAMVTRQSFGDSQLHIEWMSPNPAHGIDQDRGNSGVFFMGMYEVQILDSYNNITYADGQAASLYGQYPPLVNASRPPGVWQSYDIVFRRPRFDASGHVQSPAIVTVLHNGVLVQDHVQLVGPTANQSRPPYTRHADRLPIALQDHGHLVRFRNIWLRNLEARP